MMFLGLDQVYYWRFIYKYTNITIKLEIIYKSNQRPSEWSLGLDRQSDLIRREAQEFLL